MNRLRAYREIENKSGAETAKLLGISTSMVSAIESGRRPLTISLDPLGYSSDRFELPDMPGLMRELRTLIDGARPSSRTDRAIPEELDQICFDSTRVKPEDRIESAAILADVLERHLGAG